MPFLSKDVARFESKFVKGHKDDCWEWLGKVFGYGKFAIGSKYRRSHRLAYVLYVGAIPRGLFVLHSCDNRCCVNPNHLWVGTQQDNMDDMVTKGRQAIGNRNGARLHIKRMIRGKEHHFIKRPELSARGERHGLSKLSDEQVKFIRDTYHQNCNFRGWTKNLAALYGVHPTTIGNIARGGGWKHIPITYKPVGKKVKYEKPKGKKGKK